MAEEEDDDGDDEEEAQLAFEASNVRKIESFLTGAFPENPPPFWPSPTSSFELRGSVEWVTSAAEKKGGREGGRKRDEPTSLVSLPAIVIIDALGRSRGHDDEEEEEEARPFYA